MNARVTKIKSQIKSRYLGSLCALVLLSGAWLETSYAQEQVSKELLAEAWNMYSKLNGVPPTLEKRQEIAQLLAGKKFRQAAIAAVDAGFYNNTLRLMVTEWTNEERDRRAPLNDFTTTVIGMVRDDVPFNTVLSGDIRYIFNGPDLPTPALNNNDHYAEADQAAMSLATDIVQRRQSDLSELPAEATAGVMTTQAFGQSFFLDGTNRAAMRFTFMSFICRDMEQLTDNTRPDFRVRQDVSRSPGGDSEEFKNKCQGCHAGMDALAGATAHYDYSEDDGLIYNTEEIPDKFFRDASNFIEGYATTDDSWINLWVQGSNEKLGWGEQTTGNGLKSFGAMLTESEAFSQCMATQALQEVCRSDDEVAINQLANSFRANDRYSMKNLFAEAALMCRKNKE